MKKILFLLMLVLSIQSICFAEDVYIGSFDGTNTYLQTDTVKKEIYFTPGSEVADVKLTYSTVLVFDQSKLDYLKRIYLDDKVDRAIVSYTVDYKYNTITNKITSGLADIIRNHIYICDSNAVKLYERGEPNHNHDRNEKEQYIRDRAIYVEA